MIAILFGLIILLLFIQRLASLWICSRIPLLVVTLETNTAKDSIYVKIKNMGQGLAMLKSIKIYSSNQCFNKFDELIKNIDNLSNTNLSYKYLSHTPLVMAVDKYETLLNINKGKINDDDWKQILWCIEEAKVCVEYSTVFGNIAEFLFIPNDIAYNHRNFYLNQYLKS